MSVFLLISLIAYLVLCVVFFFGQHYFFFRPEILPSHFEYEYIFPSRELIFEMEDGGIINAVHFEVPNALGVIYYLKGNSRSIKGWGKFAKDFLGKGYDFFMMDYRGFGKSKGKRNESTLYGDANHLYGRLAKRYGEDKIIIYGRSFGTGIAAYVASKNAPQKLILDSPYYSFTRQIRRFGWWLPLGLLLKYKLPTNKFLRQSACPAHIIHGDRDYIISYKQGVDLAEESGAELITIRGGRHNNLPTIPQYQEELYRILTTRDRTPEEGLGE